MKLNNLTIRKTIQNLVNRQVKGNMYKILSGIRISQPEKMPKITERYQITGQLFLLSIRNRHLQKQISRSFTSKIKEGSDLPETLSSQTEVFNGRDRSQVDGHKILEVNQKKMGKKMVIEKNKQFLKKINKDVFEEIRKGPYFIDKTLFIREIQTKSTFDSHIICGPRRMGKTVNLKMLYDYYAIYQTDPKRDVDVSLNPRLQLFKDTLIYQDEEMRMHFGRYPIIYLDLSGAIGKTFDRAQNKLADIIVDIRIEFEYLLKDKTLTKSQLEILEMPKGDIIKNPENFLIKLCVILKTYYGVAPMILIDEFDAPLMYIIENYIDEKDKKDTFDMYKEFFGIVLKTNQNRNLGILTGVSRSSSTGLFSGWNNLTEYNFIDRIFVDYYGFKEQELHAMLDRQNFKTDVAELKRLFAEHYNGYNVEGTKIYNPYSVVRALINISSYYRNEFDLKDPKVVKRIFARYWFNTSAELYLIKLLSPLNYHFLLKEFLDEAPVYSKLEHLHSGHTKMEEMTKLYETAIHDKYPSVYDQQNKADDILISFLVTLGYLTVGDQDDNGRYKIYIPNKEIKQGLQLLDKSLMEKFYNDGTKYFEDSKKLVAELLTIESTLISDKLRKICANFLHILLYLQKAVVKETKEIVSPGVFVNERTLHHYIEWAAPKNNKTFFATEWNLSGGRPDVVFADLNNRIVIFEAKYNNKGTRAGYDQTRRYANLIKERLPQAKSVLCIVLNYINDDPNNKRISDKNMAIEYQYSLHQYDEESILPAAENNEGNGKIYISDEVFSKG